ncbi:hypothetical protein WN51_06888 [Melipona quadrifasciata]|uniref:Uncharacterized protein n=1 Tax=Melipona quadrifasciata TaxID=166423 RepID=A0A0M8ZQZ0_9HYME|nr:hypothetical protein WN51_06888 [Melipona quadrifasciata]
MATNTLSPILIILLSKRQQLTCRLTYIANSSFAINMNTTWWFPFHHSCLPNFTIIHNS